jgi:hypothetical protein
MDTAAAQALRKAWNDDVKALSRMARARLVGLDREELTARGTYRVFGSLSKDELVNDILDMRYPREALNESIHVLYHVDGVTNSACDLCALVPGLAGHTAAACDTIIEAGR